MVAFKTIIGVENTVIWNTVERLEGNIKGTMNKTIKMYMYVYRSLLTGKQGHQENHKQGRAVLSLKKNRKQMVS